MFKISCPTEDAHKSRALEIYESATPEICPLCHQAIQPSALVAVEQRLKEGAAIYHIAYQCSRSSCSGVFIGLYTDEPIGGGQQRLKLRGCLPRIPKDKEFAEVVTNVSPRFAPIYNQALAAEAYRLDQICGMGYRKALEFLIKDYAIHKKPDDKDSILRSLLSRCINDYVDNPNIKLCAEKAAWLGNDEAHYLRKWEDHDISDLKTLIRLTVLWIEGEMLTDKYGKDMSKD